MFDRGQSITSNIFAVLHPSTRYQRSRAFVETFGSRHSIRTVNNMVDEKRTAGFCSRLAVALNYRGTIRIVESIFAVVPMLPEDDAAFRAPPPPYNKDLFNVIYHSVAYHNRQGA